MVGKHVLKRMVPLCAAIIAPSQTIPFLPKHPRRLRSVRAEGGHPDGQTYSAGNRRVQWNANGQASGVVFARMSVDGKAVSVQKVVRR